MEEKKGNRAFTIAQRVENGETIVFSNWSKARENDLRTLIVLFVLSLLVGILVPDPEFRFFAYGSPLFLLLAWSMSKGRSKMRGSGVSISADGVDVQLFGEQSHRIAWQELDGVTVTKKGIKLFQRSGEETLIEGQIYSLDKPFHMSDVLSYIAARSQFFHDRRDVEDPPPPRAILHRRIWIGAALIVLGVTGVFLLIPALRNGEASAEQIRRVAYMQVWIAIVWGSGMYMATVNLVKLDSYKRPYLWDRSVPFPIGRGYTVQQHRRLHRGSPPRIELEQGKTYIHMGGTDAWSMLFVVWTSPLLSALFISAPFLAMLEGEEPDPFATLVLVTLGVPMSILMITVAYWHAKTIAPFVSKLWIEGGELVVERQGGVRKYPNGVVRERKSWLTPSQFGFWWEEIGDDSGTVLVDRRYLRELDEDESFERR